MTTSTQSQFFRDLKTQTAAVKFAVGKFGVRKALSETQRDLAAANFEADAEMLSASKKLLDTRAPAYRAVTAAIAKAKAYWRTTTVPYPDPGIRLMKRDKIEAFEKQMAVFKAELTEGLQSLKESLAEIIRAAQERLGSLFCPDDYPDPERLASLFWFGVSYPSLAVPEYLKELNPQLYEAEMGRLEARLQDAVAKNEQELVGELNELVVHLLDKLSPGEDGKGKQIRAANVENLADFFSRFKEFNVTGHNAQLEEVIAQAEQAIQGVNPTALRKDGQLRDQLRGRLDVVKAALGTMVVERPGRAYQLDDEPAELDPDEGELE